MPLVRRKETVSTLPPHFPKLAAICLKSGRVSQKTKLWIRTMLPPTSPPTIAPIEEYRGADDEAALSGIELPAGVDWVGWGWAAPGAKLAVVARGLIVASGALVAGAGGAPEEEPERYLHTFRNVSRYQIVCYDEEGVLEVLDVRSREGRAVDHCNVVRSLSEALLDDLAGGAEGDI